MPKGVIILHSPDTGKMAEFQIDVRMSDLDVPENEEEAKFKRILEEHEYGDTLETDNRRK